MGPRSITVLLTTSTVAWAQPGASDAELARQAALPAIVERALAQNPALAEASVRVAAAEARTRSATRLPDPAAKYEQWGVPLARPLALGSSDAVMLGLRQELPAWGTRQARARLADEEAAVVRAALKDRRVELIARVRLAHADYTRADHELRLHREHVELTARLVDLARQGYQTGRGTQQDVLRLALELSRLHADVARIEQERRSTRVLLNALMNRPPTAPLGPAPEPALPAAPDPETLVAQLGTRPDVIAAERAIVRDEAAADLVRRMARAPSFMVGVDYMYMPMMPDRHGYGAMLSMSLPWLAGRRAELDEAEATLRADRHALEAARLGARVELEQAAAAVEGARAAFTIVDGDLLPQARRSLDAAQAAFAVGQGDAVGLLDSLRSYLQVRVERIGAIARLQAALAELDRAAGREANR